MNSRKGSMSLGVSSIVVLIIAVIVLGLVIGFINHMFTKISRQVQPPECTPEAPTGSNPLTMCPSTLVASPGEQVAINLMFYNYLDNDVTINQDDIKLECTGDNVIQKDSESFLSTTIPASDSKGATLIFKINSGIGKGIYLCRVKIPAQGDKDWSGEANFKISIE